MAAAGRSRTGARCGSRGRSPARAIRCSVGAEFPVKVRVNLGAFTPDDVEVQLFHGVLDSLGEIADPRATALQRRRRNRERQRACSFTGSVPCRASGQFGFSVRVLPKHPNLAHLVRAGAGDVGLSGAAQECRTLSNRRPSGANRKT